MLREELCCALESAANAGDWRAVVRHCEIFEMECIAARMDIPRESGPLYAVHLCAYLIVNDLNNARFLWKRIPQDTKEADEELCCVWNIAKQMWQKNYGQVYELILGKDWSGSLAPMMKTLKETYQTRSFALICRAYSTISVQRGSQLLGMANEELSQFFEAQGWSKEGDFFTVKAQQDDKQSLSLHQLQDLTKYIVYLES